MEGSPSIAEMFTHIHLYDLWFVSRTPPSSLEACPRKSGRPNATLIASRRC